ncbi:MAG: hypothetical protein HYT94_02515 [Parcubacteria group bacterium]|nr:hypothetical protein [Parcubacteria group bacterium]
MNILAFFAVFSLAFAPFFSSAEADNFSGVFSVSPLIFDEKAKQRDILKETIGIMNNADHSINLYAFVNNVNPAAGVESFESASDADLGKSLANWIEISRGAIDLMPGEKREIPFLIQVNLRATAGIYHAFISFGEGSTRVEAEKNIKDGISVAINVEILDDAKEALELKSFTSGTAFVTGKKASFLYDIQNIGNRPVSPKGQVRIFNRSGEEVAALDVNQQGMMLEPSISGELASAWDAGSRFGRYKAMLDVEYGDKQRGTLQDTIFFWLIPWKEMLAVFLSLGVLVLSLTIYWHNGYTLKRRQKLAHAGVFVAPEEAPPAPEPPRTTAKQGTAPEARQEAVRLAPRGKAEAKPTYVVNLKK